MDLLALARNEGGAGGFHEGMKRAHADGAHWMWLMDDDTVPRPDALAELHSQGQKGAEYAQKIKSMATKAVGIGEEIIARAEVVAVREDKPICTLATTIANSAGETCLSGTATTYTVPLD